MVSDEVREAIAGSTYSRWKFVYTTVLGNFLGLCNRKGYTKHNRSGESIRQRGRMKASATGIRIEIDCAILRVLVNRSRLEG